MGITVRASSMIFPESVVGGTTSNTGNGNGSENGNGSGNGSTGTNETLDLNAQGRCVMTDHGKFVIFNVYVPASTSSNPTWHKMVFLHELRRRMDEQRTKYNKKVMLIGDLNISRCGVLDLHWRYRKVHVDYILGEVEGERRRRREQQEQKNSIDSETNNDSAADATDNVDAVTPKSESMSTSESELISTSASTSKPFPQWKIELATQWEKIQKSLSTLEVLPITTENISTGSTAQKYRSRVTIVNNTSNSNNGNDNGNGSNNKNIKNNNSAGRKVYIGKTENQKIDCLHNFTFPERTYYDHYLQKEITVRKPNVVPITTLHELMSKIANVHWDERTLASIANCSVLSGVVDEMVPHVNWLNVGLLVEDGMVDAFRLIYPSARGRYVVNKIRSFVFLFLSLID